MMRGPRQTTILVGMPVENINRDMRAFVWQLVLSGSVVLIVGLTGGWLVSRSIIRPVESIAKTASRISGDNLSERIDEETVETELSGLASVLNDTFDRLQEAFDRQTQFTADASHELRTPLAVLRSQAELTLSRSRSEAEYRQAIDACLKAAIRMTGLVEKMLLLARSDSGATLLKKVPVKWADVVQEAIDQLEPLAKEKKVTQHKKLKPVTVSGDSLALSQVVCNLISNAIQYNRSGGRVEIRLRSNDIEAELEIRDNGPGIPEVDQPHIFERFYRVDKARTRTSGGNGLGLAICLSIVKAHAGEISFESTPGEGTTFWVRLPIETTGFGEP
jgi:two-component system, OmpR family, sensor kinase